MKNCIHNHYILAFFVSLAVSIGLLIGGYMAPPQGVIDGSILKSVGELFLWPTLAAGVKALDDNKQVKIKTAHTTLTVGKKEDGDDELLDDDEA